MNVISRRGLLRLAAKYPDVHDAVTHWHRAARKATWRNLTEVRALYASADQVGHILIFNLRGNNYRLIVRASFQSQRLYVKALLTHAECDRKEWMKWA